MTATIMYCYYDDEHEGAGCHTHAVSSFRKQVFDMCTYNIPGTQTTSIFKGRSPKKNKAKIPIKTRVIWVLGICIYIYIIVLLRTTSIDYLTTFIMMINIGISQHSPPRLAFFRHCRHQRHALCRAAPTIAASGSTAGAGRCLAGTIRIIVDMPIYQPLYGQHEPKWGQEFKKWNYKC